MARSREEIEHGPAIEVVARFDQTSGVATKRRRIAAHKDEDLRFSSEQCFRTARSQTLTSGVGDHNGSARGTPALNARTNDANIEIGKVDPRIRDRVAAALNRSYRPPAMKGSREQPDTGVRIDQGSIGSISDHRTDLIDKRISTGGSVLEERIGRDAHSMASDVFMDPRPLALRQFPLTDHPNIARYLDVEGRTVDDHESLAGSAAGPDDDGARAGIPAIDQKLFDAGIDGGARVGHDNIV